MSEFKPLARKAEIVLQEFEDETLVYDLVTNKAMTLNKTSSLIWKLCDGTKTVTEIAKILSGKLNNFVSNDLILMSLEQLKKENLIEADSVKITTFENLTRREMVLKIGFASVVALPVISSLFAPIAVNAASCAGPGNPGNIVGCSCNINGNCTSNCCATTPAGNTCVAGTPATGEPPGSGCRTGCECASNSCPPAAMGNPRICT